ncbi:hypothetical protein AB0368_36760 [Actinoplanes sp. NPDC051475]|uniref:hypothetical protein n=1 Tax=Actinoplanes sp. NPDC051475 TaxID=3157225 RepID=UPI003450D041
MLARALRRLLAAALSVPMLWQPGTAHPAGNADAYAFLSRRSGHHLIARWNPCEEINYRVNLARAPRGSLVQVETAVARIARATGLRFSYAGTTGVVPGRTPGDYPPDTQLIIAWAVPGEGNPSLSGGADVAGVGGATYLPGRTESGEDALIIDRGMVLLDATSSGAGGAATGRLLLHELGHAVGLAHPLIDGPNEIMYPLLTAGAADWGAGDLAGLHAVGASGGCLQPSASVRS